MKEMSFQRVNPKSSVVETRAACFSELGVGKTIVSIILGIRDSIIYLTDD